MPRFTIKTLMVATAFVAVGLGGWAIGRHDHNHELREARTKQGALEGMMKTSDQLVWELKDYIQTIRLIGLKHIPESEVKVRELFSQDLFDPHISN